MLLTKLLLSPCTYRKDTLLSLMQVKRGMMGLWRYFFRRELLWTSRQRWALMWPILTLKKSLKISLFRKSMNPDSLVHYCLDKCTLCTNIIALSCNWLHLSSFVGPTSFTVLLLRLQKLAHILLRGKINVCSNLIKQVGVGILINNIPLIPYTRVNKRNSLLGAYWLLSTCFFPGFCTWIISAIWQYCKFFNT